MPPQQLRLRLSHQQFDVQSSPSDRKEHKKANSGIISSSQHAPAIIPRSPSFDTKNNITNNQQLSSQSLRQALHPPHNINNNQSSTPSKPQFTKSSSSSSFFKSSMPMLQLQHRIKLNKKCSTLFLFATLFAIGAIERLHYLALHSMTTQDELQENDEHKNNIWNAPPHPQHQLRTKRGSSSNSSQRGGRLAAISHYSHPRVVNFAKMTKYHHPTKTCSRCSKKTSSFSSLWGIILSFFSFQKGRVLNTDPMLHHDGWVPPTIIDNVDGTAAGGDEVDGSAGDSSSSEEESQQCVPMAEWQTTSYPNCNTVHEIDLVRSSGPGSLAFSSLQHDAENNNEGEQQQQQSFSNLEIINHRRSIASYPPTLLKRYQELLDNYPNPKRKKTAKLSAQGIMKEEWLEFLGQGWFRSAWEVYVEGIPEYDDEEEEFRFDESVVLKTLRIERDFLEEYYELHRRDALAMERLTFSPYVLDIYGYCGQSAINELANFGIEGMSSLEKVARSFRGMDHIEPVSKIKLQLASMVAAGVSHMHSIDYPDFPERDDEEDDEDDASLSTKKEEKEKKRIGNERVRSNVTLVHYDLNPRNIAIIKRGKPKLNDFNVAEFLTWDPKQNKTCGFTGRFREPWWRAPEEMHFHLDNYTNPAPLTEKIDIYSLGNIMWDILTSHSPRGKMTKELEANVRPSVARGELPTWPSDFNKTRLTTDPALAAIDKAMRKCLRANPEDRPTAGEIADELSEAIDNLPEGFGDKERWKAINKGHYR